MKLNCSFLLQHFHDLHVVRTTTQQISIVQQKESPAPRPATRMGTACPELSGGTVGLSELSICFHPGLPLIGWFNYLLTPVVNQTGEQIQVKKTTFPPLTLLRHFKLR